MSSEANHRNVYHFAIFIVGLNIVLSLVQIIVESLSGYRFYLFSAYFEPWFILINIISMAVHLILIWYFRVKNYTIALTALVATFAATLAYTMLAYKALADKELWNLVPGAFVMLLCVGSIYSVSLFTSRTRHKRWLFWAGILEFPLLLILIALQLWAMNAGNGAIPLTIGKVMPWILVLSSLTLVFYILNFKEELDLLKNKGNAKPSKLFTGLRNVIGVISRRLETTICLSDHWSKAHPSYRSKSSQFTAAISSTTSAPWVGGCSLPAPCWPWPSSTISPLGGMCPSL